MIDLLYTLFIAPLEYWMKAALLWGHRLTGHWGEAILLMSLIVNFVILPIYMKAEKWQEEERALRKSFEAKEKMIKRTFKGQERFAMISTMQRQAGYSPFLALRSSVGFFLQIPFFFAAYHFLSHFEPLAGVSFLGLPDLAKPDGLIKLGGFSVNVMPFVMTVINLASALIYTKNLTAKDKNQLYAMAAVFLVLLYDAASGLVLYWTCNNVFSLAKNLCYDLADRWRLVERLAAVKAWMLKKTLTHETVRGSAVFSAAALLLWAAATVLALFSSNQMDLIDEVVQAGMSRLSDGLYLAAMACVLVETVRLKLWREHKFLLFFILFFCYYLGNIWRKYEFLGANRHHFAFQAGLLLLVMGLALWNLRRPFARSLYDKATPAALFVPASAWLVVLVAGYLPVQAFSTAPEAFSPPDVVLAKSLMWCVLAGLGFTALYWVTQLCHAQKAAGYFVGALALILTVYAFFLPMDVGTIDAFQIANLTPLYSSKNLLLDVVVLSATLFIFGWCVKKGYVQALSKVFSVACVAGLVAGGMSLWQSQGAWHSHDETQARAGAARLPEWTDRFFTFSRNHPNTVIVMMDGFSGNHMRQIIDEMPEVTEKLTGFTWYADAMAVGNNTISSVATIFGGRGATPGALNAGASVSIAEKINEQYAETIVRQPVTTDVAMNERNWLEPARLMKSLKAKGWQGVDPIAVRFVGDSFLDLWLEKTGGHIGRGNSDVFLLAVSLFKSVPWSGKNLIYKDGRWIDALLAGTDRENTLLRRAESDWAFINLFPEMSKAIDQKGATIKFIDTEITHAPWKMELGRCRIVAHPKQVVRPNGVNESHLALESCTLRALGTWFDWMKREGVYRNTNIVLVSDHGGGDSAQLIAGLGDLRPQIGRPDSLLLFKPAGVDEGAVKESMAPVQILNVGEWLRGGKLDQPLAKRQLWDAKPSGTQYLIERQWANTGRLDDPKAWTREK